MQVTVRRKTAVALAAVAVVILAAVCTRLSEFRAWYYCRAISSAVCEERSGGLGGKRYVLVDVAMPRMARESPALFAGVIQRLFASDDEMVRATACEILCAGKPVSSNGRYSLAEIAYSDASPLVRRKVLRAVVAQLGRDSNATSDVLDRALWDCNAHVRGEAAALWRARDWGPDRYDRRMRRVTELHRQFLVACYRARHAFRGGGHAMAARALCSGTRIEAVEAAFSLNPLTDAHAFQVISQEYVRCSTSNDAVDGYMLEHIDRTFLVMLGRLDHETWEMTNSSLRKGAVDPGLLRLLKESVTSIL